MPHVHQVPVCKHQHSRHSLATPACPSRPGTTPRGPRPQTHRPAKYKMTDPVPLPVNTNVHNIEDTQSQKYNVQIQMPPRPQPGMQPTATTTAVYRKPARWHSAPRPHKTMRHLPRVAPSKIQCTNPNASQAAARHANHGHHNCRVPKTSPLTALPGLTKQWDTYHV